MPTRIWPLTFWKLAWWRQRFRVSKSTQNIATLNPRQIYIVPTRWGLLYAVMLIGLLIGSINYTLSLGFYVTFLLASLGNVAVLHTWRNLVHLQVAILKVDPVFAGDTAEVIVKISDTKNRARYSIVASFDQNEEGIQNIAAYGMQLLALPITTSKRGLNTLPRLTLYTEFPLSLLHAWAVVENPFQALVYPAPSGFTQPEVKALDADTQVSSQPNKGDEDFSGHKNYQFGDSPSRIDWKASSRNIGMFTKQYSGTCSSTLWLDWDSTNGEKEARISQLTRQVIDAHAGQLTFGLKLPRSSLQPSNTDAHYHQTLTALALFD